MNTIETLLEYARKTNPELTRDKLIEVLQDCPYLIGCLAIASRK